MLTIDGKEILQADIVQVVDNGTIQLGAGADVVLHHRNALLAADAEITGVIVGTSDHQGVAANSLIVSNITASGDILGLVNNGGNSLEWLLVDASARNLHLGHGMTDITLRAATVTLLGNIVVPNGGTIGQAAGPLLTFDDTENALELTGADLIIGHTAILNASQFEISKSAANANMSLLCYSATDAESGIIYIGKSSSATIGTNSQTATGEAHGGYMWMSPSGIGNNWANVANINVVQNGAATTRSPMEMRLQVSDGTSLVERLRIGPAGWITTLAAAPANVTAAGAIIAGGGLAFSDVLNAWIDDASHGNGTLTHYIGNAPILTGNGVNFGPAAVASITVVNGQITNIS